MNCNVHVFYKMIFGNKFGFILETSLFLYRSYSAKVNYIFSSSRQNGKLTKQPSIIQIDSGSGREKQNIPNNCLFKYQ